MTAGDRDEDDQDPMLRGMRSVWLEMRDEEPPSRGLADLMAAAREQAAVMKPAEEVPWWRRAFAMMVRPPMLAAATVVVLIGGAVVLKGRGPDEHAAAPSVSTIQLEESKKSDDSLAKQQQDPVATPEAEPAPRTEAATGFGSASAPQPAPAQRAPRARPAAVREPAIPPTEKPPVKESTKREDQGVSTKDKAPDRVQQPGGGLVIAGDAEGGADDKPVAPTTVSPRAPGPKGEATDAKLGSKQVSTEQLIKQTEVAASRNDCAAVRVTAERIKKLDAAAYKSRVANQPAIARCLK